MASYPARFAEYCPHCERVTWAEYREVKLEEEETVDPLQSYYCDQCHVSFPTSKVRSQQLR